MNAVVKIYLFCVLMVAGFSCKEETVVDAKQREQDLEHAYEAKRLLLEERYQFRMLYEFSEGLACFETDTSVGAIDSSGKFILEFKHATALSPFSRGYAVLTHKHEEEHRSFINKKGQVVFNAWENGLVYIDPFDEYGYSFVTDQHGNRGLLDTAFRLVFPLKYENIYPLSFNRFLVTKDFKTGIAGRSGNLLVPARFDQIDAFTPDQKMFAQINEQWGIYDSMGKILHVYDCDGLLYTGGLILLNKWNKTGGSEMALADTAGNIVVPYGRYNDCSSSHDGLAMVYNRQHPASPAARIQPLLFGYVDLNGRERIPLQYEDAYSFQDGLAKVKKNGKWGYIDTSGKTVIDLVYDKAGLFYNGFATVERNGKAAVIDQKGNILIQY
ncbi:MAG: WG repeat-containing protein [Sphingobacteriia bacterium]|nr:WG repeat-containing protein [Sphingobacteriia bacterium]